jgi:hypothetical protein
LFWLSGAIWFNILQASYALITAAKIGKNHDASRNAAAMSGFRPPLDAAPRTGRLGPAGPFPSAAMTDEVERRWLHYAMLSRDGRHGLVANAAWLGPPEGDPMGPARYTTILLLHERGKPWISSQFNATISEPPWSAFRLPQGFGEAAPLHIASHAGEPAIELMLTRTSRPCSSQCAFFSGSHHLRWQSETGVQARGIWHLHGREELIEAVGYHERVRGRWGWPQLDEWVFGFANDLEAEPGRPPRWAAVFTFIKPQGAADGTTASLMLWRDGVMRRHFPRRRVSFAVRGMLDRDRVTMAPPLAGRFGEPPIAPVPQRLVISARMGEDWVVLDFEAEAAARVVIPSESSAAPFTVHEVVGPCLLEGGLGGERFALRTRGIVEFSGGAA